VYIELHTSSAFSFLRAASLPEPLIERAALLGYPAVALLDRDGVYGAPRFHKAAKAAGLRSIVGAELTISGTEVPGLGTREGGVDAGRVDCDTPGEALIRSKNVKRRTGTFSTHSRV